MGTVAHDNPAGRGAEGTPVPCSSTHRFVTQPTLRSWRCVSWRTTVRTSDLHSGGAVGREHGTLLKTQLDSSTGKRKKPRSRKRTCKREGHLSRDWLDMETAGKAESSLLSRTREMNGPFRHHRFEGLRAAMVRKRGNRLGEKENGLPDAVQSSARGKEKGNHVQVFFTSVIL